MYKKQELNINFIDFRFETSLKNIQEYKKNIKSIEYKNICSEELKKYHSEYNKQKVDKIKNTDEKNQIIRKLKDDTLKFTIYKTCYVKDIHLNINNIENYSSEGDSDFFWLSVLKGKFKHNPDYLNIETTEEENTNKKPENIDNIILYSVLKIKFKKIKDTKYLISGVFSYINNYFDNKLNKDEIEFIVKKIIINYGLIDTKDKDTFIFDRFDFSYSTKDVVNFIENNNKISWITYKTEPNDFFVMIGDKIIGTPTKEKELCTIKLGKTVLNSILGNKDLKDYAEGLLDLKDLTIKTKDGLFKNDKFFSKLVFPCEIDSKGKISPTHLTDMRNGVKIFINKL